MKETEFKPRQSDAQLKLSIMSRPFLTVADSYTFGRYYNGIVLFCFVLFLRYAGLSLLWPHPLRPLPLRSTGSGRAGSAAMAHGPSRSAACGIFLDRGTNPCPLHRQADSQPLRHQGSPESLLCFTPFYRIQNIALEDGCRICMCVCMYVYTHSKLIRI